MKTLLVMLFAIGLTLAGVAQEKSSKLNVSKSIEDVNVIPAQFVGVDYNVNANQNADLLKQYLSTYINKEKEKNGLLFEGTEVVKFTVTETGKVKDIKFVNSVSREIEDVIVLALESTSGKWKPAVKGGNYEKCYPELSFTFSYLKDKAAIEEDFRNHVKKYYDKASKQMLFDHKFKKAERTFSEALNYAPYDECLLYLRGVCRYERGDKEGAMNDWTRLTNITGSTVAPLTLDEKQFKGVEVFAELNREK